MVMQKGMYIDYFLINNFLIDGNDLNLARRISSTTNQNIYKVILDGNMIDESEVVPKLAKYYGYVFILLENEQLDKNAIDLIPGIIAAKKDIIPVKLENNILTVAICNPSDIEAVKDIEVITNMNVLVVLSTRSAIRNAINKYYGDSKSATYVSEFKQQSILKKVVVDSNEDEINNAPTVKFVENLLYRAINVHASDIHIEPTEYVYNVRFRVDGVLRHVDKFDKDLFSSVISRIKVISNIDISQHFTPQDGHTGKIVENTEVDLRVNTLPTIFGEKAVIRIIYKMFELHSKNDLGMSSHDLNKLNKLLKINQGVLLVTGPTGSGKTTTLASCISELNNPDINIITIEDPVEYVFTGVNQVNINNNVELTFANVLRSILRQDPDVIMIGEMRDFETAQIAIRAAITGHLVLSTLHTNDAVSAIVRLVDMGIEPYLIVAAVSGIISQRLVRVICPHCKVEYKIDDKDADLLKIKRDTLVYRGAGCHMCDDTGYKGRIGVFEVLTIDGNLHKLIVDGASIDEMKNYVLGKGFVTFIQNTIQKVLEGITTIDELYKVAFVDDNF